MKRPFGKYNEENKQTKESLDKRHFDTKTAKNDLQLTPVKDKITELLNCTSLFHRFLVIFCVLSAFFLHIIIHVLMFYTKLIVRNFWQICFYAENSTRRLTPCQATASSWLA